jgi:hypothetical protein
MNTEQLNRWLTLLANLGVIIGLIFLIVELDQSNRIARYDSENARRSQFMEINSTLMDHAETFAKLKDNETNLTPAEEVQAVMIARLMMNTWQDAETAYEYGLLSETTFELTLNDISVVAEEAPGLLPYFLYLTDSYDAEDSKVIERRVAELARAREED